MLPQHSVSSLHPDDRRKADKLKKKKRRKERQHLAAEERAVQQDHSSASQLQLPISFNERTIKEEPEDDVSIPLHPQRLPSPPPYKIKPKEEHQHWEGQDLQEGMVKVQKIEGFSGSRTVFRQGKQVVFRDEDGSGEDEDIMVDSGKTCGHTTGKPLSPAMVLFCTQCDPAQCAAFADDDSWDLVTCFCMKPFAGRAMIECNKCNTWIHLSCAKIRKSHVPETYVCQRCRETHGTPDTRRSHRSRATPSKHLLD